MKKAAPKMSMQNAMSPMMKKGGKMMHKAEGGEIKEVEKELKEHEHEKDSMHGGKAHMKIGGAAKDPDVTGFTSHKGGSKTGDVEQKFKKGGKMMKKATGGMVKNMTKTTNMKMPEKAITGIGPSAKMKKSISSKTGSITTKPEMKFKKGGKVGSNPASYISNMSDMKPTPSKLGTKGIKQAPAGYKEGGFVAMNSKSTADGFTTTKKMQKC